jgi:uncharacterized membrane protein
MKTKIALKKDKKPWFSKIRKSEFIIFLMVVFAFIIGIYFYPILPAKIASHWNIQGQVDGYMSKFWGLFLFPIILLFLSALFVILPKIDPKKENIEKFRIYFDNFIILLIFFLFYVYGLTIAWNLGARFNIGQFLIPAFSVIFFYAGILIKKAKQNWFIGIKTPWTLSNKKVWDKTHQLGAKMFMVSAFIALIGIIFPTYAFFFVIFPIIFSTIYLTVYSYFIFRKLSK